MADGSLGCAGEVVAMEKMEAGGSCGGWEWRLGVVVVAGSGGWLICEGEPRRCPSV